LSKEYFYYNDSYTLNLDGEEQQIDLFNSVQLDPILGSAHSIEDCYILAILDDHGPTSISRSYRDFLNTSSLSELQSIADELGIDVIIEGDEE